MTVRNINTVVNGNQVTISWDMDLTYAYVMLDATLVAAPGANVTTASIINQPDAYLEILDDNSNVFDAEAAASEYPRHKVSISWTPSGASDIASYNVLVNGTVVANVLDDGRTSNYTYESARLTGSIDDDATFTDNTIDVKCVDTVGNIGLSSQLSFQTLNASPPVLGLVASQTVLQKINLVITAPSGW